MDNYTMVSYEDPQELADIVPTDLKKDLIDAAILAYAPTTRDNVWRIRMDSIRHYINVIEYNLDYDLRSRNIAA